MQNALGKKCTKQTIGGVSTRAGEKKRKITNVITIIRVTLNYY